MDSLVGFLMPALHCTISTEIECSRMGLLSIDRAAGGLISQILGLLPYTDSIGDESLVIQAGQHSLDHRSLCSIAELGTQRRSSETGFLCVSGLGIIELLRASSSAHISIIIFRINDILLRETQQITRITPEGICWQLYTQGYIRVHEAFFLFCKLMQR